ncbi:Adenosylmethionine-8-amino-7-oxononanoate aminotransferase [Desulfacinum hydrothermale DSM 13146]|uniref:Adenosylmethionine-8-amino-7-oxononanoate aminotransferase n=1 Tax=Desulfacinum hydrothermale DSM 13146 TaxID=1121390 RepID=A0A1W1XC12_9BACT|nr:aspartate aminotransferase family protein [Desulfacinum hydrothermale]SMC21061.1 Adenosylmethionine-8-amino-7-oxononanoate aminotransferase [Desulfacinum hydrothermale DSM 13146]
MLSEHMENHVFYRNLRKTYPVVDRGEGIHIWDKDGNRYIDGSGGACVVSLGHGVPEILEAMKEQAARISFAHGSHFTSEAARECADRLVRLAPDPSLSRVYFLSGGSEAVETAVKVVRQYWREVGRPDKYKVISRWVSFHGNTMGAVALGGHTARRRHYHPHFLHTPHIEPAYCYRCPFGREPQTCSLECAEQLERTIKYEGPDAVAAFIAEPVVGATAGALVPRDGYWQRIREICDTYEVKLIADEVMTGVGRTGRNFCLDHWSVVPDVIVSAKGLSSGYTPLGAVIVKEEIHDAIRSGSGAFVHGHTYSQNPLSVAVGAAVLRYLEEKDLIARCATMGEVFLEKLRGLLERPMVGDVRGLGLFAGVELVQNKETKAPFAPSGKISARVAQEAFRRGLITYPGSGGADGINGDHILLAPPFIITEEELDEIVRILGEAIQAVEKEVGM